MSRAMCQCPKLRVIFSWGRSRKLDSWWYEHILSSSHTVLRNFSSPISPGPHFGVRVRGSVCTRVRAFTATSPGILPSSNVVIASARLSCHRNKQRLSVHENNRCISSAKWRPSLSSTIWTGRRRRFAGRRAVKTVTQGKRSVAVER